MGGASEARAVTYTWSGAAIPSDTTWPTNWNATPVSATDTALVFTSPTLATTSGTNAIVTTNTGGTPFLLNSLTLTGLRPAASSATTITIAGSAFQFVKNGITGPVINLDSSGGSTGTLTYNITAPVIVADDLTIAGTGNATAIFQFSGGFSGTGNITKTGSSNRFDVQGSASQTTGFYGNVTINAGQMRLVGSSQIYDAFVSNGALSVASGASVTSGAAQGGAAFGGLYGDGTVNFSQARRLTVNYSGLDTDVFSGSITGSTLLEKNGTGLLKLTSAVTTGQTISQNWGSLELPALTGAGGVIVSDGVMKVTANSGVVLGTNSGVVSRLNGGTLWVAPDGSGANVTVTAASAATAASSFRLSGGRLLLDKGANQSLTLQLGNSASTLATVSVNPGGLILAAASGLAQLGVTEKLVIVGANTTPLSVLDVRNNMVIPRVIGQDNDANLSGNFLSYTGTGLATDAGFSSFVYSGANADINFAAPSTTKVTRVTSAATIAANTQVFALRNDGQVITVNSGQTLVIGDSVQNSQGGLIMNGGEINGGTLAFTQTSGASAQATVYTSLANATIGSNIVSGTRVSIVGPGVLKYTGTAWSGVTEIYSGATLDVADGALASDKLLTLAGGVLQSKGSFTRALDSTGVNLSRGGGFAARGGSLTVNIGGSGEKLYWNNGAGSGTTTANFLDDGAAFVFGSVTADNEVIVANAIDLGGNTANFTRVIHVVDNANSTTDRVRFTGGISSTSGNNGIAKSGAGTLVLDGVNSYKGATYVSKGTLLVNGSLTQSYRVEVQSGATLGGTGTVNTAVTATSADSVFSGGEIGAVGTLNLTGGLVATNGATFRIDINGASADQINFGAGAVTLNGPVSLVFGAVGDGITSGFVYSVFIGSGTWSGTPTFDLQNPLGYVLDSSYGDGKGYIWDAAGNELSVQFSAVPEPAAFAHLLGCAGLAVGLMLRRRNARC